MSETAVRAWRSEVAGGCLCMAGTTSSYAVDPLGEHIVGVVVSGAMRVRRGGERFVFGPGDVCAWDPSAAHRGTPHECDAWEARLLVLETSAIEWMADDDEAWTPARRFASPHLRDRRLARRFVELHRLLESSSWTLERETRLMEWLHDLGGATGGPHEPTRRRARRDPALRRACALLADDLAANVTLDELAVHAGVSRHRLSRLFRAAYGLPPQRWQLARRMRVARQLLEQGTAVAEVAQATGFFDQSHLHRHFRRTLGITPAHYAALTAQTYKTPATG